MNTTSKAELYPIGTTSETPFTRGQRIWDERVGTVVAQKSNWQRLACLALLMNLGLGGAVVYLATFGVKVLPYVVEVAESGQVRTVGILPDAPPELAPAVIQLAMQEWLPRVRGIITDPVAYGEQLKRAQFFMTPRARRKILPWFQAQIEKQHKGATVTVVMGTFTPVAGHAQTYQIEWIEEEFTIHGAREERREMMALLHIDVVPVVEVKTAQDQVNPLGILVRDFDWNIRSKKGGG